MLESLWLFSQQPFNHLHCVDAIEGLAACSSLEPFEWLCSEPKVLDAKTLIHANNHVTSVDDGPTCQKNLMHINWVLR